MVSSTASWTSMVVATALALTAAAPIVYYKYQHSVKKQERQDALKLLRRVDRIVAEVFLRLMHLGNQIDDLIAEAGDEECDAQDDASATTADSTLGSYYHFDSNGNKLKTKWDSYDVDAELDKLESDEQEAVTAASQSAPARAPRRSKLSEEKPKLLLMLGGIEQEFEAVLEFLDGIRGDDQVRETRKAIAAKINSKHFARIDALRERLA